MDLISDKRESMDVVLVANPEADSVCPTLLADAMLEELRCLSLEMEDFEGGKASSTEESTPGTDFEAKDPEKAFTPELNVVEQEGTSTSDDEHEFGGSTSDEIDSGASTSEEFDTTKYDNQLHCYQVLQGAMNTIILQDEEGQELVFWDNRENAETWVPISKLFRFLLLF